MPELDNAAVARLLEQAADLLEISGADKYRFLAYRTAARNVRSWPEDVSKTAAEGRLTQIPGVGAKLAAAIESILATGSFPELDEVAAVLPPSLVTLMQIPGVGPKTARTLYDAAGVSTVDDLERAIADGTVRSLPGFGEATVRALLEGIERYRRLGERMLLSDALPLAEKVAAEIAAVPGVVHVEPAGSIRRRKETVGDVDLLVASEEPAALARALPGLPVVSDVIASGEAFHRLLTSSGIEVDLRVVEPRCWGAALQHFTGSAAHNVALRERAKRMGLKVSEYGLARRSDGAVLACATEQDVYGALGLATPPPEIREDAGEIEAAEAGMLPRLVELSDIRGDLHVHSVATDGRSTLEQIRARAAELGYEYVAVTDHALGLRMVGGLDLDALERQWDEIDRLNAEGRGPQLLKGIELNIGEDGEVDYPLEVLARFDLCIASLHTGWGQPRERATARVLSAMENPYVDVIGHLTGRVLRRREPIALDVEAIVAKAAETGTVLELDAYPDRLDIDDSIVRMAVEAGALISIDTDAHEVSQMAFMRYGVWQARRGWATREHVLNARSLDQMLGALKRSRPPRF
ncbi:MAG: DNA polymerase/3'-5' exonuclease PolX [Anaerosomatales bacterium]|nr:DNA polymerase/3'-5' exonuclease PolX [Anaerosomatales bacterium]